jgi:hypothetical protein
MGLPKDKTKIAEWKDKIRQKLLGRRVSMKSEFKKGQTPFNKGTKGLMKANKTSFKKGNVPANFMNGYKVSKDGIYVRVGNKTYDYGKLKVGKYEALARLRYRQAFGEFDKKLIVFHKDGDLLNNEIDNLELITRKELLKRNSYRNIKPCVICGVDFAAKVKKCKTCSIECRKEYNRIVFDEYRRNPESKERLKICNQKYRQKPEVKERMKIYNQKYRQKPEVKERMKIYNQKRKQKAKANI